MDMIADKDAWAWARNEVLLADVRNARSKLEEFKKKSSFWENWTAPPPGVSISF